MLRCFNEPECHDVCHIEDTQVKVFIIILVVKHLFGLLYLSVQCNVEINFNNSSAIRDKQDCLDQFYKSIFAFFITC